MSGVYHVRSGTPFSLMDRTNDLDRNGQTSDEYLPAGTYSGIGQDAIRWTTRADATARVGRPTRRSTSALGYVSSAAGRTRTLNAFVDVFNATNEPNFANPINFNTNTGTTPATAA